MREIGVGEIAASAERLRELIAEADDAEDLSRFSHVVEQFEASARAAVSETAGEIRDLIKARRGVLERR